MEQVLHWSSVTLMAAGSFFTFAMTIGMLRFPDAYTRLHAGTKGLTIGGGLILIGAALVSPDWVFALRILLVGIFMLITNPIATQAVARANYSVQRARHHMVLDEYQEFLEEENHES
ncbi:monovalent cation/H(+) antiporter subunit G [Spirochaeta africana]|uniref:Monovalent cation/proton antiporter, MnhG/PhaG subunit n=1 Tax=Spirochaeta africana (strain ATCC 700263 / DSM 8902 / Z-7692) TaxID=889378 RepID=H9ULG2_SPIAZ|nr:monovalent cation/H(+) antiporter subunit G [Spirochaeta africana]AFG38355.1 monovalent cation/proton antiporter, MnhG/PhaG subunit [Spirochaeta africana DSM 8902]